METNKKNGLGAQGFDLVQFFKNEPVKGSSKFSSKIGTATYLFSSEINKKLFDHYPEKYLPQYGGYCSIAMSEGKLLNPNPRSYILQDDKLFFFTRKLFGLIDAKRQWMKDPILLKEKADLEWAKITR